MTPDEDPPSISQRELRNSSGEVLRRVANGESILVTNSGVPAAVLVPTRVSRRDRLIAAGRLKVGTGLDLSDLPKLAPSSRPSAEVLDDQVRVTYADTSALVKLLVPEAESNPLPLRRHAG